MTTATPPRVHFQDVRFSVAHIRGAVIDRLIGIVAHDRDLEPALILMLPRPGAWQRFFLDAGFAVWAECDPSDVDDDLADDSFRRVDLAERFQIRGAEIHDIRCAPALPDATHSPEVVIQLSSGVLTLRPIDPIELDSGSIVSFSSSPAHI